MKQAIMSFSRSMLAVGLLLGGCAVGADGETEHTGTVTRAAEEAAPSQRVPTGITSARVFEAFSDTNATGNKGRDLVFPHIVLVLDTGTWLVEAEATVFTDDVPDALNLGLYDATHNTDIAGSRSGIGITPSAKWTLPLHTSKVVTVTAPTAIQLKLFRNGGSTPGFGYPLSLAGGQQRLFAIELL